MALLDTSLLTEMFSVNLEFTTILRSISECGHMDVITKQFRSGLKIGPPAASEYAVEPVGVEMITPSARTLSISAVSDLISISIRRAKSPLERTASFRQWLVLMIFPFLITEASSMILSSTAYSPFKTLSKRESSFLSTALRKPSLPPLMPRAGFPLTAAFFATFMVVPSPPSTTAISHALYISDSVIKLQLPPEKLTLYFSLNTTLFCCPESIFDTSCASARTSFLSRLPKTENIILIPRVIC